MSVQLASSFAKIYGNDGVPVGCGLLIKGGYIFTAASVVMEALDLYRIREELLGQLLTVEFPFLAPGKKISAEIAGFDRLDIDISNNHSVSYAILRVLGENNQYNSQASLVRNVNFEKGELIALGFSEAFASGHWQNGVIAGQIGSELFLVDFLGGKNNVERLVLNGSPVVGTGSGDVIGMMVSFSFKIKQFYMIPSWILGRYLEVVQKTLVIQSPYPGLSSFREEESGKFFGRKKLIDRLLVELTLNPLLALIGPQGSGKTSLIRAGLIPELRMNSNCVIVNIHAMQDPFVALASGLSSALQLAGLGDLFTNKERIESDLRAGQFSLQRSVGISEVLSDVLFHVLVIVDSFEDWIYNNNNNNLLFLIDWVLREAKLFQDRKGRTLISILLVLDTEFLNMALSYPRIAEAIQGSLLVVAPMSKEEVISAIECPAHELGFLFQEGLASKIADDVLKYSDSLPALQSALTLLWKKQENGLINLRSYMGLGDPGQLIAKLADESLKLFTDEEKQEVRRLFLRLIVIVDNNRLLLRHAKKGEFTDRQWNLAVRLAGCRLLTIEQADDIGTQAVRIINASIIRHWELLAAWLRSDWVFLQWRSTITNFERYWENHEDSLALIEGKVLQEAEAWLLERASDLTAGEVRFILASREYQQGHARAADVDLEGRTLNGVTADIRIDAAKRLIQTRFDELKIQLLLEKIAKEDPSDGARLSIRDELKKVRTTRLRQWKEWFEGKGRDEDLQNLPMPTEGYPCLMIRQIRLRNIKAFSDGITIDFFSNDEENKARLISIILGDNSVGKTTVLKCIALAAHGASLANGLELRPSSYLGAGKQRGFIEASFVFFIDAESANEYTEKITIGIEIRDGETSFRAMRLEDLTLGTSNSSDRLGVLRSQTRVSSGLVCGYGATRILADDPIGMVKDSDKSMIDRVSSLFVPHASLMDPDLLGKLLAGDLSRFRNAPNALDGKISIELRQKLEEMFPGAQGFSPQDRARLTLHGVEVDFRDLSDGYCSLLAMVGHFIYHALAATKWNEKPSNVRGLVLIDELDLHLHPGWQRRVLLDLARFFPYVQIVATSHSAVVAGSASSDSLIVFHREDGNPRVKMHLSSVKGWRVDQILTSELFSLDSARDQETEELISRYAMLLNERGPADRDVQEVERELARRRARNPGSTPADQGMWSLTEEIIREEMARANSEQRSLLIERLKNLVPFTK